MTISEFRFPDPACATDELRMLRETVRRFVEGEVWPRAAAWEHEAKIPRQVFRQLGTLGLLGMRHEPEFGGTGMGPIASMVFAEELGRSTFGGFTASVLVHTDMSSPHITIRGTAEQKRRYLPRYHPWRDHLCPWR